jgi:hypothetical protein
MAERWPDRAMTGAHAGSMLTQPEVKPQREDV